MSRNKNTLPGFTCPTHGEQVERKVRWNHEEDRYAGDYYACPDYKECGQYFDVRAGQMKKSSKF